MKPSFYGRLVFGLSAVIFGIASLIGHDSDMWQRLHTWKVPSTPLVAWCLTIALVAGGAAMLIPRTARLASVVLGVVYGLFTLACTSDMIAAPSSPGSYVDFFEQLAIVCGAIAVYAATGRATRSATLGRIARLLLGICSIAFAWAQVAFFQYTASLVPKWIPPSQAFWTTLTTVAFGLAALAILVNRQARLALRMMALMVALFGVIVWVPRLVAHPGTLSNWTEFSSNYLIAAAAMLVAGLRAL